MTEQIPSDTSVLIQEVYKPLTAKEFKKEYGFQRVEGPDKRPWQVKLREASKGWGLFGVYIQGILLNKALSNLSLRRNRHEN
ncbi:MAG: hypothetical protein V1487_04515 [bacterium]